FVHGYGKSLTWLADRFVQSLILVKSAGCVGASWRKQQTARICLGSPGLDQMGRIGPLLPLESMKEG
ncbi:hypothetical protein SB766_28705, partial [Pseudomonas sp. SIMBA_077]